jgi:hypothetical protein
MVYQFFLEIYLKRKVRYHNRKKKKYFRALVENNQGIITVIDEEFKLCLEALHLLVSGYSNKEFDAIADEDYYHPDYLEYAHNKIR